MASSGTHESIKVTGSGAFAKDTVLRGLSGREALSEPFEFRVDLLYSGTSAVDYDKILGEPIKIEMDLPESETRYIHGIAVEMGFMGTQRHWQAYQVVLRPWFWLLTRTSDSRIYQEISAVDIIKQIFGEYGYSDFEDKLTATSPQRVYCVQYRESDFDFINRLMEEEGIYYYFKYESSKHTLVLCDGASAHSPATGYSDIEYRAGGRGESREHEVMGQWLLTRSVRTGAYSLRDFDFEKPKTDLTVKSSDPAKHSKADFEYYDYPGRYIETSAGDKLAKVRREALQAPYELYRGSTNARGLSAGCTFKLTDHPDSGLNMEYLIVEAEHMIASDEPELGSTEDVFTIQVETDLTAIDNKRQYRPPAVTPKSVVRGPQTAVVVGSKGEEIWTDKYGRVKIQFHWDREGKMDEKSSCWVRVSHAWAGKKWGQIFLPRIGQEVIVDFLEGDPDQPIITGRVYNADNMPPYTLPGDQNKSTMKSHSTKEGVDANFNELRFDDTKDKEEVYFHAEKDFNRVVENNDTLKVGFEKKEDGDQSIEIYNNQNVKIGLGSNKGNQTIEVAKNQDVTIGSAEGSGSQTLVIEKDRTTTLNTGDDTLTVSQGDRKVSISAGNQETDAAKHILMKVGGSSIKIEPAKITIKSTNIVIDGGMNVDIKAGMNLKAKGGMTFKAEGGMTADLKGGISAKVTGGAMLTLKGGITMIN